jgi:hypothetical protein
VTDLAILVGYSALVVGVDVVWPFVLLRRIHGNSWLIYATLLTVAVHVLAPT